MKLRSVFLRRLMALSVCAAVLLSACVSLLVITKPALAANEVPGTLAYYAARLTEAKTDIGWLTPNGSTVTNEGPWRLDLGLTPWDGVAAPTAAPADTTTTTDRAGAEISVFAVYTATELRYCVTKRASFKLMNDIDLNGQTGKIWTTPGNSSTAWVADGNGHTIYNYYSYHKPKAWSGLSFFGQTSNATIKNLRMSNSYYFIEPVIGDAISTYCGFFVAGTAVMTQTYILNCAIEKSLAMANSHAFGFGTYLGSGCRVENSYVKNSHMYARGYDTLPWSCAAQLVGACTNSLVVENCFAIDGTVIAARGHSGAFTTCAWSPNGMTFRNCFTNVDIYGETDTGAFNGVMHGGPSITFENCFDCGKVEGVAGIGGFSSGLGSYNTNGIDAGSLTSNFRQCYSTAMVGGLAGGQRMGGFLAGKKAQTLPATMTSNVNIDNCYAAGEVGSLDIALATGTVGGFIGDNFTDTVGNKGTVKCTNNYYDKQTTAMREWTTGQSQTLTGIKGVLTTATTKAGAGLTNAPGTVGASSFSGFANNNLWVFEQDHYPQLAVFANPTTFTNTNWMTQQELNNLVKSCSRASTSTVKLETWETDIDGDALPATTYDTVRDVMLNFPMTSAPDTKWDRVGNGPTLANGTGNVKPLFNGQADVPILELLPLHRNYGSNFSTQKLVPGIEWLRVNVKQGNQIGTRALRILPTSGLRAGSDQSRQQGSPPPYNHREGVFFAHSTAARMALNENDLTFGGWPGTTNMLEVPTGDIAPNSKVTLRVYPALGMSVDGKPILGNEIVLSNDEADDYNRQLNGIDLLSMPPGRYLAKYIWEQADGRYMTDHKYFTVAGKGGEKNAYINGSETPENGEENKPANVSFGDLINYKITVNNSSPTIPPTGENPLFFEPLPDSAAPQSIHFINGSFEQPVVASATKANYLTAVPGWKTRPTSASDDATAGAFEFEYWKNGFKGVSAVDGTQFAELNANVPGTLYQDCATTPGTKVYWEFFHRGRDGLDTLDFYLYGVNSDAELTIPGRDGFNIGAIYRSATDKSAWVKRSGSYIVPAGQTLTRFAYQSVSSNGGVKPDSMGNLLDGVRFYTNSFLTLQKSSNAPNGKADIGDTVTYTVRVNNLGESDASRVVLLDTLPLGMEYQPDSTAIAGSAVSDAGRVTFDEITRELRINVGLVKGEGSFSNDCQNNFDVSFRVLVNDSAIAENLKYENQARIQYDDRDHETDGSDTDPALLPFVNYSNVDAIALERKQPGTITDYLPEGLEIVSHEDADGRYSWNAKKREITWAWDIFPSFETTVSVEVRVTDRRLLYENRAVVTIDGFDPFETNHTYHSALYILHVRQVVLEPSATLEQPLLGYLMLTNHSLSFSATCFSGNEGAAVNYTVYKLPRCPDPKYLTTLFVPQNYFYDGYMVGENGNHNAAQRILPATVTNGAIALDYSDTDELWLTLYIKPFNNPGEKSVNYARNDFRTPG